MVRRLTRCNLTDTLFPYTTLLRAPRRDNHLPGGFPGDCSAFMAVAAAGPGEGWPGRLAKSHAVTLRWRTSTALAATLAARPAPRTAGSGSVAAYGNRQRRAP